ncbi:CPCC family cysteine-rich protein [Micromonospora sp. M12]
MSLLRISDRRGTCPVCFWTDDGQTDADADAVRGGPNGDLSLSHARLNYAVYGASHPRYQDMVRAAPDERPERRPTGQAWLSRPARRRRTRLRCRRG